MKKQNNGKYLFDSGDIDSILYIADRRKNIFFSDSWGSMSGIDSIYWLTDTILIAVGNGVDNENVEKSVYLFIKVYTINKNNTVDIKTYNYEKALTPHERNRIKLRWLEQRSDYFEFN